MGEPYYEARGVTLWHGDCREILPSVEAADCAIVDPPYGDTNLDWDRADTGWLAPLGHALAPAGSFWCWGSMRLWLTLGRSIEAGGWRFSQDIVWEKHNGSGSAADRFRRVHEHALLWYRAGWADTYHEPQTTNDATARTVRRKGRPPHWGDIGEHTYVSTDGGPRLTRSVLYERSSHGTAVHPTQKPLGITGTLIAYSCPPGGTVLDPFAGSGTTLLAARSAGRRAVGIERDESYCEATARRLEAPEQAALDLASRPVLLGDGQ